MKKTIKKVAPKEVKPLNLVFEAYSLSKMLVSGYIIRGARKKCKIDNPKTGLSRKNRAHRAAVEEMVEVFTEKLNEEIARQLGWNE